MHNIVENFLELIEIDDIVENNQYINCVDISVEGDASFMLASGLVSHNSASSAFRKFRDPNTQGAFPLRGKFLNVSELPASKIIQNKEVKDILNAMGLRMGEAPKDLRYGSILIYSDADPDGDSIAGLLTNFFGRFWPELLSEGKLQRVMTPLVVVKGKKEQISFYTNDEFESWMKKTKNLKDWDISYKKGLAALEDSEYKEIIQSPNKFAISPGDNLKQTLDDWFGADPAVRKIKILGSFQK